MTSNYLFAVFVLTIAIIFMAPHELALPLLVAGCFFGWLLSPLQVSSHAAEGGVGHCVPPPMTYDEIDPVVVEDIEDEEEMEEEMEEEENYDIGPPPAIGPDPQTMGIDERVTQQARWRNNGERAIVAARDQTVARYRHHFADELDEEEKKPWWGRLED